MVGESAGYLIEVASSSESAAAAKTVLLRALDATSSNNPQHQVRILSKVALEETNPGLRASYWQRACFPFFDGAEYDEATCYEAALALADCLQDPYAALSSLEKQRLASSALSTIDRRTPDGAEQSLSDTLKVAKSKIVRHSARFEVGHNRIRNRLNHALRLVGPFEGTDADPHHQFEAALVRADLARYQKSDVATSNLLREAEAAIDAISASVGNLAHLELARIYKWSHRIGVCCRRFERYFDDEADKRRLLRNTNDYCEAVISTYYSKDRATLDGHLELATELSRRSVDLGCGTARDAVNNCFLLAIGGKTSDARRLLSLFVDDGSAVDWKHVEDLAQVPQRPELIGEAVRLGLSDAYMWSRLGTLARDFLNEPFLAHELYEVAYRHFPSSAMVCTNLARWLLEDGAEEDVERAYQLLRRASSTGNRFFVWWRPLLQKAESMLGHPQPTYAATSPKVAYRFSHLRNWLHRLEGDAVDPSTRGREYERLINHLCEMSFRLSRGGYSLDLDQIDGYFTHDGQGFLREVKWKKKPIGKRKISAFLDSIPSAGTCGVFIAKNGFARTAVEKAKLRVLGRQIILIDGEEVELAINELIPFDEIIRIKYEAMRSSGQVYYKIEI